MKTKAYILLVCLVLLMTSCTSVKPYEAMFLNDSDMQLGFSEVENFENHLQNIREAGSTAGGIESGGGCGCN